MNIVLWVLQILLALHTFIGAVWKFSHTAEQTMPVLKVIPQRAWLTMSAVEILCSLCLVVPVLYKPWSMLVPIAAVCIAGEMLLFSGILLFSGESNYGPLVYWFVVAALCAFIAYGRFQLKPL